MRQLAEITQQEIALISSFQLLLDEEQEALKRANAAALPALSEKKLMVIGDLNALEAKRAAILGCKTGDDTKAAMEKWLNKHPDQQNIASHWKQLLDLARQAKESHELNGRLVHMQLQQTNELLAALSAPGQQQNTLYGSNGQPAQGSGSRIVDSA